MKDAMIDSSYIYNNGYTFAGQSDNLSLSEPINRRIFFNMEKHLQASLVI